MNIKLSNLVLTGIFVTTQLMGQINPSTESGPNSLQVITYGFTEECQIDASSFTIQHIIDQVNHENPVEIRVVNGSFHENLSIDGLNLSLVGGFLTCEDAENNIVSTSLSVLNGSNHIKPVIQIENELSRKNIKIKNFFITEGGTSGAGIQTFNADVDLVLDNLVIANNQAFKGGGIGIFIGETKVTMIDVLIQNNHAEIGGGIYCNGSNNQITMISTDELEAGVFNNHATNGSGGGAMLESGCELISYGDSELDKAFSRNTATENGGGVAIDNSRLFLLGEEVCNSENQCFGNNTHPASVSDNLADSDQNGSGSGGGVYVTGPRGHFLGSAMNISKNQAFNGGGIAAYNNALIQLSSTDNPKCWDQNACIHISQNTATNQGGALDLSSATDASMVQTLINLNHAENGAVAYIQDDAELLFKSSLIVNNGTADESRNIFQLANSNNDEFLNTQITVNFSTLADNIANHSLIENHNSSVFINGSIIHQSNPSQEVYDFSSPVDHSFSCVLSHTELSIPNVTEQILVADPLFVDRNNTDFHLTLDSPAIDYCGQSQGSNFRDIDDERRGFDQPDIANVNGSFDIGADEIGDDLIFSDGFERRL